MNFDAVCQSYISNLEYEAQRPNLKYIKIQFNAPVFDKVTKDRAAKFVDQLSAIGGTMHTGPNSLSSCYGGQKFFKKKENYF